MRDDNSQQQQDEPVVHWRVDQWFPDLSPDLKTSLKAYHSELIEVNRTLSLISAKSVFVADALHFADSILASRVIHDTLKPAKIHDLGSGAGFPGVIFALLYPKVQVVLVDADKKRTEFLDGVVSRLKLKNVEIINKAVETLPEGSVQVAMCRGFSTISKTIMSCRKIVPKGGILCHLKGEEWGMEVGQIPTQLCSIWSPSLMGEYKLPVGPMKFSVIKTDKIS